MQPRSLSCGSERCISFGLSGRNRLQKTSRSAEIDCMPKNNHEPEIFAVIQFGGTSREQYLHSFSKQRDATSYIRKAERASYQCLGPFSILLSAEGNLARTSAETIEWLQSQGFGGDQHTLDLERALAEVEDDLNLS